MQLLVLNNSQHRNIWEKCSGRWKYTTAGSLVM